MSEYVALGIGLALTGTYLYVKSKPKPPPPPQPATTLFFHIKHADPYPYTLGKVQQIYSTITAANNTGRTIGLEPQCTGDWLTQLQYLQECGDIPVMLNVLTSDDSVMLTIDQIAQAMDVCNVQCIRFHEALSYFQPFPLEYVLSVLAFAKANNISVFWNEWDVNQYPTLASIIAAGYEDTVIVSFGTNNNWLEPSQGYQLLQQFQRKGASVQSWYWYERNNRIPGTEMLMPPELMVQFTSEAFLAGCEIVQYEPFGYFFDNEVPITTLTDVLSVPQI